MECVFDVLSFNTAGIGDKFKRRKIFNYLKKSCSSKGIVLLQETHSTVRNEATWTSQWGRGKDSVIFSHRTSNSKGVLIAFRESINYKSRSAQCDANGRYIILDLEIDNCPFILINYYAPNDECQQLQDLEEISNNLDRLDFKENTQFIWGGDFNVIFDEKLDADGGNPKLKDKSITKIISMMSENDLCDIYRVRNPQSRRYTWRCKTPLIQRRLDYLLISDQLQGQIEAIDFIPSVQSDHSTVRIRVNEKQYSTKGRSYWKFNNSLTHDDAFVQALRNEIPTFYSESSELADPVMKWDYLKYKIRQFAKQYSIVKAKERRAKRIKLELRVKELEGLLSTDLEHLHIHN